MTLNCRSLRNKTASLKVLLEDHQVDVAALQETWLNRGDNSIYHEVFEYGYKVYKLERAERRGGGLAILVNARSCSKSSAIYNYKYKSFDNIVCSVSIANLIFKIVNIYRTPSESKAEFLKQFESFLELLTEKSNPNIRLLFLGDYNINLLGKSNEASDFLSLLTKYDLTQLVIEPTRESTLLDLVIANIFSANDFHPISNKLSTFPSDHKPQLVSYNVKNKKSMSNDLVRLNVQRFGKLEQTNFRTAIKHSPLSNLNEVKSLSTNECINLYNNSLKDILNYLCPKTTKVHRANKSKIWFNNELNELKLKKRRAERAYNKNPKSTLKLNIYKRIRNDYTKALKERRVQFYEEKLNKFHFDPKNLHKALNELTGNLKQQVIPISDSEKNISNKMAIFYKNKVQKIHNEINLNTTNINENKVYSQTVNSHTIKSYEFSTFKEITLADLEKIISSTKKKYCILDPGPTSLLFKSSDLLNPIILKIVNDSISNSAFPDYLKQAIITPVIKNQAADIEQFNNYRPVSSISFLSKILEKVMHQQLNNYLNSHKLYPFNQSSYRRNYSCETALLRMTEDIKIILSKKRNVFLILLDSSAAFDTVSHKILLEKLNKEFNIHGNALNMIKSYFKNRQFLVKINDSVGSPHKLEHGVPQGSLLGPLFYVMYTKKIEEIVCKHNLRIHSYADDIQIYAEFDDENKIEVENQIKNCLKEIQCWMRMNYLKLNEEKTMIKIFKHKQSITEDVTSLGEICHGAVKILGAQFSNIFKFNEFVSQKTKICNYHLRNLYNIKNSLNTKTRILLVTNLILTTIDYCNILLLGATSKDLRPLKLMINKTVRFIYDLKFRTHVSPFLKKAHFLPISKRITFKACLLGFKILNNQAPEYFLNDFPKFVPLAYSLRPDSGRDSFMFSESLQENLSNNLFSKIKREWNMLPFEIRSLSNISSFKKRLKSFLLLQM